jgi:hypothetical protein
VDNAVADYLASGRLPKRLAGERSDKRCPPYARPDPTNGAAAGRRAAHRIELERLLAGRNLR